MLRLAFEGLKPAKDGSIRSRRSKPRGLDAYTIAYTVNSAINGAKVGVYREGKEEYDILLSAADGARASIHRGPFEHGVGML